MTLPNLPAGCAWPKRPSGLASQWFPRHFEGEVGSSVAYTNGACVQFSREADSHRLYALSLERLIPQVAEAARREEREACALLHENLDVDCGVEPMSVAIEYRDKIRARGEPC